MSGATSVIEYDHGAEEVCVPVWPLKIAAIAGALPLCVGTGITVLFHFSEWRALMEAGFLCFVAGMGLFGIGVFLILFYRFRVHAARSVPHWSVGLITLLLFVNWPIAILCFAIGASHTNNYRVVLTNASTAPVSGITIRMENPNGSLISTQVVGNLAAGASQTLTFKLPDVAQFSGVATIRGVKTEFHVGGNAFQRTGPIRSTVTFGATTQPTVR